MRTRIATRRLIAAMGLLFLVLACQQRDAKRAPTTGSVPPTARPAKQRQPALLATLTNLGFFSLAATPDLERLKADALRYGWPYFDEANRRTFFADAETLAEGGIADFLEELRPSLELAGATWKQVSENVEPDYTVEIDGQAYLIYSSEELALTETEFGLIWGLATARGFALVNGLLKAAQSPDRLFAVGGGNDQQAYLLTDEMYQAIIGDPETTLDSRPYTPTEDSPWFGMPH